MEIGPGQQALTIDFALVRGHLVRIAGTAPAATARRCTASMSLARSARSGAIATPPVTVRTDADGAVRDRARRAGRVRPAGRDLARRVDEGQFAAQFVTVEGDDVTGLSVHLSPGSTIAGRI